MNENENEQAFEETPDQQVAPEQAEAEGQATEGEFPERDFINPRATNDFMDRLLGRLPKGMDALSGKKPLIRPREVTFLFDGSAGAPEIFTDADTGDYLDVEITVRSLSSADEIEALSGISNNIGAAPYALAKRSLHAVEGKPLNSEGRDLIWEALGSTGRQLVLMAFQGLGGGASEAAMGKYRSSFSII